MAVFSIRHRRAINAGDLELHLSERLRGRLLRTLRAHNETWHEVDDTNWNYETDVLSELPNRLLDVSGADELSVDGKVVDVDAFVRGAPAVDVCDVVELFVADMHTAASASGAINDVFSQEDSPLRLLEGEIVKLDGGLLASMADEAHALMASTSFDGALRELRDARDDLMDGDVQGAVHEAGKSFESVAMGLMDVTSKGGSDLVGLLREAGYFSALPDEAVTAFCKQVMHAVPAMRNKLGGHGQGRDIVDLPLPYGKLAVHLGAAFNLFLLELAIERGDVRVDREPDPAVPEDLADFRARPAGHLSDDDIPF